MARHRFATLTNFALEKTGVRLCPDWVSEWFRAGFVSVREQFCFSKNSCSTVSGLVFGMVSGRICKRSGSVFSVKKMVFDSVRIGFRVVSGRICRRSNTVFSFKKTSVRLCPDLVFGMVSGRICRRSGTVLSLKKLVFDSVRIGFRNGFGQDL